VVFRFKERRTSRRQSVNDRTQEREYVAAGSSDELFVRAHALAGTAALLMTPAGILYRQDILIEPQAADIWHVRVPYGPQNRTLGSITLDYDTTGGTIHLKAGLAHIDSFAAAGAGDPPDHQGAIGVNGDEVEGVEVVSDALKLTVTVTHPAGIVTLARIKHLRSLTGRVNSDTFLTFPPGEVLFLGSVGRDGTNVEAEASYQFACSENLVGQVIAGIEGVKKDGWDVAWIEFRDAVDGGKPVRRPKFLHVDRVYKRVPMAISLGFGG
jgi:hypothetical protein